MDLKLVKAAVFLWIIPGFTFAEEKRSGEPTGEAILALQDFSGQPGSLGQYRGRIVVLNFWATWCVPCREEMPVLVSLHKRYAARGVTVIGASADQERTRNEILGFIRELKIDFPIWVGATTADMQRLGLGTALPATAIVDRDGRIAARILGVADQGGLRRRVEWLLGDRCRPAPPALVASHEHEEGHAHGSVMIEGASTVPS